MAKSKEPPATTYFVQDTFRFLKALQANNDREWFLANKERYESAVKDPFLRFIADFSIHLEKINRHFVADPRPNGGSMMRIYRDIRFSKDKSPYKTWVAAHFPHQAAPKEWQSAEYYLHLSPEHCFAAGGMWHPDPVVLKKVRDAIVSRPKAWKTVVASALLPEQESGARPPKGYKPDHPFIEDLKRKDFCAAVEFKPNQVRQPGFILEFAQACRSLNPLMKFLTEATGLPW